MIDLPRWDPERDDTLVCTGVRDETDDVRTFVFRAEPERLADRVARESLGRSFSKYDKVTEAISSKLAEIQLFLRPSPAPDLFV